MLSICKKAAEEIGFAPLTTLSRAARGLFILAGFLVFATLLVPRASAQAVGKPGTAPIGPCCPIKSINAGTGIVTAVETATGRSFQFSVKDRALLKSLRVGQAVSADFNTSRVTISGIAPCCSITSLGGGGRNLGRWTVRNLGRWTASLRASMPAAG